MKTFFVLLCISFLAACQPTNDSRGDRTDSSAMNAPTTPVDGTAMPVAPAPKVEKVADSSTIR